MRRRSFVRLAAAATVLTAGCLDDEPDEEETPETAEFGYQNWLPIGDYSRVGYADLERMREEGGLSRDGDTWTVVGETGVDYGDVNAYLSAEGERGFLAFSGSFDEDLADDFAEELDSPETTVDHGYTVITGTSDGISFEVALSEDTVVASNEGDVTLASGGGDATTVLDAAVGGTTRQYEGDELLQGFEEYAEEPIAVLFDYGIGTPYQFADIRDDGIFFVEVSEFPDEESVEEYEYPGEEYDDVNVERDGTTVVIETEETVSGAESLFLGDGGLLP